MSNNRKNKKTTGVVAEVDPGTYESLFLIKHRAGLRSISQALSLTAKVSTEGKDITKLAKEVEQKKEE